MKWERVLVWWAWVVVVYLLGVILFGAWVRITGSGAGCGEHWPLCHGEIVPRAPSEKTVIELTHRVTSGLCGPLVLGLMVLVGVRRGVRDRAFWGVVVTMGFVVLEALIGAGIVLKALVEDDDSVARAVVVSLHLVNTLVLMGAASLTAWWLGGGGRLRWGKLNGLGVMVMVGMVGLVVVSVMGAVTALGDTLFPVEPTLGGGLLAKVREDLGVANHFLVRLRAIHPVMACGVGLGLFVLGDRVRGVGGRAKWWGGVLMAGVGVQVVVGVVNIAMGAPGWMQLVHLLGAQGVWIAAVLTLATLVEDQEAG